MIESDNKLLWSPSEEKIKSSSMYHFMETINKKYALNIHNYKDLHQWSINNRNNFWEEIWDFYKLIGEKGQGHFFFQRTKCQAQNFFQKVKLVMRKIF